MQVYSGLLFRRCGTSVYYTNPISNPNTNSRNSGHLEQRADTAQSTGTWAGAREMSEDYAPHHWTVSPPLLLAFPVCNLTSHHVQQK